MNPIARKTLRLLLLAVALGIFVVLLGILPFSAGFLKGPIEEAVQDATGLELSIKGPLKVRLGPGPSVKSGGISLRAPAADSLLEVDSLHAKISLLSLLRGRIHVREFGSHGIRLDYCAPLPDFPEAPEVPETDSEPPSIVVDGVELAELSIRCGPATGDDPLAVGITSVTASAPLDTPVELSAEGRISALDFELSVTGGALDELLREPSPFPVSGSLASAEAVLDVTGHIQLPPGEPIADATLEAGTQDVRALAAAFGIELPELGELDVQGRLRVDQNRIDLGSLAVDLGNSDFIIDASIDFADERALVTLSATSDQLDVKPLLVDEPKVAAPQSAATDTDIDLSAALEALNILDANIDVTVGELRGLPLDVESIQLNAGLVGGRAELHSLNAELLGGAWSVSGELNSQADCPDLQLFATGSDLDFATLNPMLTLDRPLGGSASTLRLETSSCGNTLSQHLDTLRTDAIVAGVQASLDGESLPLAVNELTVSLEPGERGRGRFVGTLMSERVEATLAAGSLAALLGTDAWPLDIDVRGAGSQLRINGRARLIPDQRLVDARIRFDAPAIGTLHAWTGGASDTALPLSATTRLRLDESRIVADDIAMSLGASDLGGRVAWSYAQDPDLISIAARSNSVDIPEIAAVLPPANGQTEPAAQPGASNEAPGKPFLPPIDLDLEVSAIRADRLDIQDLSISGRLRAGLIDAARVSLVVEDELQLEGRLDLDARQLPARGQLDFTAENLDIGRVLRRMELVDDLLLRADALELQVNMQGTTPRQFVLSTLMQADLRGYNWQIPRSSKGDQTTTEEPFEVSLDQVQFTTAPGRATTWTSLGQADGVDVELFMRAPSLNDIFGDLQELPVTLVAAAGNNVAMIDTRLDLTTEDEFAAHVLVSGQVIASDNRTLSELASPLDDYQLQSEVIVGQQQLQLPDIQMRLGSSSAQGRFEIDASGARNRFDAALHAPYLQTDDLLYWSRDFRASIPNDDKPNGQSARTGPEEAETGDEPVEKQSVLRLVNDFLAGFRENNDLDVRITVEELHAGPDLLGGGELQLHVDETEFSLSPVTFSLPGGGVDAEYRATVLDGRLDAAMHIQAHALRYGGLLRLADDQSDARGLLYLDADISANVDFPPGGIPMNLLLENAQGEIAFAAWPENFEAGVLDLWSANLVLAIIPAPKDGEVSRLNCLATRFGIEDGLMKSRKTLLDTTDTIIRGRGTIDLKNEQLDLLIWPQAKREKFLSVSTPVTITGSFDDFRIGVEPGGFIGTAIKWYTSLIYVPFKWLTGERFPADGTATCFDAMDWELTPGLQEYFLQRDFSVSPPVE